MANTESDNDSNWKAKLVERAPRQTVPSLILALSLAGVGAWSSKQFIENGDSAWAFAVVATTIVGVIVLGIGCLFVRLDPPHGTGGIVWERLTPVFASASVDAVVKAMGTIRDKTHSQLVTENIPIKRDNVRVNVFTLDCASPSEGDAGKLTIPKGMHLGMESKKELGISFSPNEGATGRVYMTGRAIATVKSVRLSPRDRRKWVVVPIVGVNHDLDSEQFALTKDHNDSIHNELEWVVSCPLAVKRGESRKVIAVLNVDGIKTPLNEKTIQILAQNLLAEAGVVADIIGKLPMKELRVSITEEGHHDDKGQGNGASDG